MAEQRRDRAAPATARHRQRRGAGAEDRAGGVQPLPERGAQRSTMSRSDRRRPATSPPPTPEVLAKYFEERKVVFRAPEYRKITIVVLTPADLARPDRSVRRRSEEGLSPTAGRATRRRSAAISSRSCSRTWRRPRPPPTSSPRARPSRRSPPSAGSRTATSISARWPRSAMVDRAVADAAFALKAGEVSAPVKGRFGIVLVTVDQDRAGNDQAVRGGRRRDQARHRDRARQERDRQRARQDRGRAARRRDARRRGARSSTSSRARSRRSTAAARIRDGKPVPDLPQDVDVLAAAFARRRRRRERAAAGAAAAAMSGSTSTAITPARDRPLDEVKDQVEARWRDDEIATRLKAKADRDAGQDQGRHVVRRCGRGRQAQGRDGGRASSAAAPPPGLPAAAVDRDFQHAAGCGRQRRGRKRRPSGSCSA